MEGSERRFEGKTAVVTGAASGMGLLFSECFLKEGGSVVMADFNEEALTEKAGTLEERFPGRVLGVLTDVRNYESVVNVREKALEAFGRIDVLVNFAGGTARRVLKVPGDLEFPDVPIEVFDWGLDVNLKGPFYMDHAVLKAMREQRSGVIVNIGSVTGIDGDPKGMDYPTAKAGLMFGLTRSVAQYGAQYGIRCVCIYPGPVLTREAMSKMKTMLGRAAEPQEVVDLVLYVISDKGAFITGENIMIDGGRSVMKRS